MYGRSRCSTGEPVHALLVQFMRIVGAKDDSEIIYNGNFSNLSLLLSALLKGPDVTLEEEKL